MSTTIESHSQPAPVRRPLLRRLVGFNLLSAVVLGVGGYYLGWFIGHQVSTGKSFEFISATDENDVALLLGYLFGVVGFLVGLGFANYPSPACSASPPRCARRRTRGSGATSACAPTTRSSACSTSSASACSSSSPGSTRC